MKILDKIPWYVQFFVAGLLAAFGVYLLILGNEASSAVLIGVGTIPFGIAVVIIRYWWVSRGGRVSATSSGPKANGKVKQEPVNSLNIYPDRIEFAMVEEPLGMMQKCYNDSRFYYVHKSMGEELLEFILPDDDAEERYYDPAEFANVVTMPSNKKYYTWAANKFQKISIGVMLITIAGLIIGLIATT